MRNLIWRLSARQRYLEALEYIAQRNAPAAVRLEASIERQVAHLLKLAHLGRPGRVERTRELFVHPNYIIVYRVTAKSIYIVRFLHAHQRYP